jgi:hypothetical protein
MAKRRYGMDEAKIQRFEKEGRGQGTGKDYKPWLTTQDVPSCGRRSRPRSFKTGRLHHCLSDIETSVFYLAEWEVAVFDIREQFPLERARTRQIAAALGINHPRDAQSQTDLVMTLDLLIDRREHGRETCFPISAKNSEELKDPRTLEKLQIERVYCQERWGSWALMTERDYDHAAIENIRWAHEMHSLDELEAPYPSYWSDCTAGVMQFLRAGRSHTIATALAAFETQRGVAAGTGLTVFRHLVATRAIGMDMRTEFDVDAPVASLSFSAPVPAQRVA